jgi:hypothetical protein
MLLPRFVWSRELGEVGGAGELPLEQGHSDRLSALGEGGPVRVPRGERLGILHGRAEQGGGRIEVARGGLRARRSRPGGERVRVRGSASPSTRDRSATFTAISRMPSRRRPADTRAA